VVPAIGGRKLATGESRGFYLQRKRLMVSSERSREGTPGTPSKKRVRYADEESLPLESFKDPSPNQYVPPSSAP
jgi:hypothetical protein